MTIRWCDPSTERNSDEPHQIGSTPVLVTLVLVALNYDYAVARSDGRLTAMMRQSGPELTYPRTTESSGPS